MTFVVAPAYVQSQSDGLAGFVGTVSLMKERDMTMRNEACHTCGKDVSAGHLYCHVCTRMFCGPCRDKDRAEHENVGLAEGGIVTRPTLAKLGEIR